MRERILKEREDNMQKIHRMVGDSVEVSFTAKVHSVSKALTSKDGINYTLELKDKKGNYFGLCTVPEYYLVK